MPASKNYTETFNHFKASLKNDALQKIREQSLVDFEKLGFPTRQDEDWRYFSTKDIAETSFKFLDSDQTKSLDGTVDAYIQKYDDRLVFINGHFSQQFSQIKSDLGVQIQTLEQALETDPESIKNEIESLEALSSFSHLNKTFAKPGSVIRISKNQTIKSPLHLVFVATEPNSFTSPLNLIQVKENAKVDFVESYLSLANATFTNAHTEIHLAAGAIVNHTKIQNEGAKAYHIGSMRATQERDSQFHSFNFTSGAKLGRNDIYVTLKDSGSHVSLDGLYVLNDDQIIDNHTTIDHEKPHATSSQLYKGILNDSSRAVFNGKVFVRQDAQQTDSSQLNKNLLLSKKASVDTKPQLEIAADDVSCTHGATVGQISDEEMFYIESRAIPKEQARQMLVRGFADDVLDELKTEQVRGLLDEILDQKLN